MADEAIEVKKIPLRRFALRTTEANRKRKEKYKFFNDKLRTNTYDTGEAYNDTVTDDLREDWSFSKLYAVYFSSDLWCFRAAPGESTNQSGMERNEAPTSRMSASWRLNGDT